MRRYVYPKHVRPIIFHFLSSRDLFFAFSSDVLMIFRLLSFLPQFVTHISTLKHIEVNEDNCATIELDMDLKDPASKLFLYKVRGGRELLTRSVTSLHFMIDRQDGNMHVNSAGRRHDSIHHRRKRFNEA